jgi:hypothetical protein
MRGAALLLLLLAAAAPAQPPEAPAAASLPPPPDDGVLRMRWPATYQMNRSTCTFPDGNHSGFDNAARAAVTARYGLVTLGWQARICLNSRPSSDPAAPCANAEAEAGLDEQAVRLKQLSPDTRVLVYRNTELGMSSFGQQCDKMYDPRYAGYWLRDARTGRPFNDPAHATQFGPCLPSQNLSALRQDQFFRDFRNASSAADFVGSVVGAVARSPSVDGVWFDDTSGCCVEHANLTKQFTTAELAAIRNATAAALLDAERTLVAAGKWSDHLFATIPRVTKAGNHCISAMQGGAALGAAHIPGHMLIRYDPCPGCVPPYANSTDAFLRHLASFLIGRGDFSWMGHSWIGTKPPLWYREWDLDYGLPLGPMTREGNVFARRFTHVDVRICCDSLEYDFAWR